MCKNAQFIVWVCHHNQVGLGAQPETKHLLAAMDRLANYLCPAHTALRLRRDAICNRLVFLLTTSLDECNLTQVAAVSRTRLFLHSLIHIRARSSRSVPWLLQQRNARAFHLSHYTGGNWIKTPCNLYLLSMKITCL